MTQNKRKPKIEDEQILSFFTIGRFTIEQDVGKIPFVGAVVNVKPSSDQFTRLCDDQFNQQDMKSEGVLVYDFTSEEILQYYLKALYMEKIPILRAGNMGEFQYALSKEPKAALFNPRLWPFNDYLVSGVGDRVSLGVAREYINSLRKLSPRTSLIGYQEFKGLLQVGELPLDIIVTGIETVPYQLPGILRSLMDQH